ALAPRGFGAGPCPGASLAPPAAGAAPGAPPPMPTPPMAAAPPLAIVSPALTSGPPGVQCSVKSSMRAARCPPTNTLLEPVKTSNIGQNEPQSSEKPISPARAAGRPLTSTDTLPDKSTGPKLGSGMGRAGGGR